MEEWLRKVLADILDGRLLRPDYFKHLFGEEAMSARDEDDAFNLALAGIGGQIEARWSQANVGELRQLLEDIRRESFMAVSGATEQGAISSYVSDDFDLIVRGRLLGLSSPLLDELWAVYERGEFPVPPFRCLESTPQYQSLAYCVALLPEIPSNMAPFLQRFSDLLPGIKADGSPWTNLPTDKISVLGVRAGAWEWQLQIDPRKYMGRPRRIVGHSHRAGSETVAATVPCARVRIFLMGGPPERPAKAALEHLCAAAWALVSVGADAIIFPSARTVLRRKLLQVQRLELDEDNVEWFIQARQAGESWSGLDWFRTFGMDMFGLPDLVCTMPATAGEPDKEQQEGIDVFFGSMIPYMVLGVGKPLPIANTIELEHRLWKVVEPDALGPLPFRPGRNGIQLHRRYDNIE